MALDKMELLNGNDLKTASKAACGARSEIYIWHVTYVQDCNLRCKYCATGYGTYGMDRGVMSRSTWVSLCRFMISQMGAQKILWVEFGGGETSLHFDQWMEAVLYLKSLTAEHGIDLQLQVATNAAALDRSQLDLLAQNHITVSFSIDGPRESHDKYRRTAAGEGSFEKALESLNYFRSLPQKTHWDVNSVLTNELRLADVITFWRNQGVRLFNTTIQLPSRFTAARSMEEWKRRQHFFLEDLKKFALDQARKMSIPHFMSDYSGPKTLINMWLNRFLENTTAPCGAGKKILAVDKEGGLYPCEAFIGCHRWKIGDVCNGLDTERLDNFQIQREEAVEGCGTCSSNQYCAKNCFGGDPTLSVYQNFTSGCSFEKSLVEIGDESFRYLEQALEP